MHLIVCGSPSKNPAAGAGKLLCKLMKCMKGAHYRSPLIQKMAFGNHCDGFAEEGSDNVWLCSDMEVVRAYDHDPLCGYTFTLNGFENLFSLMQDVYERKNWSCATGHCRFALSQAVRILYHRRGKFRRQPDFCVKSATAMSVPDCLTACVMNTE